jgi:HD-GYP domain-containing protein (c-di-GMP phosphodiesterase class II)
MGLAGEAIPVGARIIMIADTVDAMTTDRPYRTALSFERVTEELKEYAGRQFDPVLVNVFLRSSAIRGIVAARVEAQTATEAPALAMLPTGTSGKEPRFAGKPAWKATTRS